MAFCIVSNCLSHMKQQARPQQHLVNFVHVFGVTLTATSPSKLKSRCTWPVFWVYFSRVVKHGQCSSTKNTVLMLFTYIFFTLSWGSWRDHVPNTSVLPGTGSYDLITIRHRHLQWSGHVCRLEDNHLPKQVLYSELPNAPWLTRQLKLHFQNVLKRGLNAFSIKTRLQQKRVKSTIGTRTIFGGLWAQLCPSSCMMR